MSISAGVKGMNITMQNTIHANHNQVTNEGTEKVSNSELVRDYIRDCILKDDLQPG